jgi:hypothetical protein
MHIQYWKNISILAKVIQVSNLAHGPLVYYFAKAMLLGMFVFSFVLWGFFGFFFLVCCF